MDLNSKVKKTIKSTRPPYISILKNYESSDLSSNKYFSFYKYVYHCDNDYNLKCFFI